MADVIKIKGGKGTVPKLQDRELAYSKDEKALYIGTEGGNVRLNTDTTALEGQISSIMTRLEALETANE